MSKSTKGLAPFVLTVMLLIRPSLAAPVLDLVPFGTLSTWDGAKDPRPVERASLAQVPANCNYVGVVWDEERDVRELRVRFEGAADPGELRVEYWWRTWPPDAPSMPTIEDPADDAWKGSWLAARTRKSMEGGTCVIQFEPLEQKENRKADALPGVTYRRTLKVRLALTKDSPRVESLQAFSETTLEPMSIRVEFGAGDREPATWSGSLEIYNGIIQSVEPWNFSGVDVFEAPSSWRNVRSEGDKGIVVRIASARPAPAGSNDMTVVTVRGEAKIGEKTIPRAFSFNTRDLASGPIYIRDFHVYITPADDTAHFSVERFSKGQTIRDRIPLEPEQTYERATREIPPLDPWQRQHGDKVYLPVAADASWQKFAVEYGGDIFINKHATKAYGAELNRLRWKGDTIRFRIGTGEKPYYRQDRKAKCSLAEDDLPIVLNRWEDGQFEYEEEAFATLLEGPLDPNDPARNEQTPAVLMMQLRMRNKGTQTANAQLRLNVEPSEPLEQDKRRIYARSGNKQNPRLLRAVLSWADRGTLGIAKPVDAGAVASAVVSECPVEPGNAHVVLSVSIPFVSDLSDAQVEKLEALKYAEERERVATYWRKVVSRTTRFTTPDPKFNQMARAVVPHIHIGTTKDPKSGLYMVPAASYGYKVYMNESCFQTQLLDLLGDTQRAGQYLKTCTALQGSKSFPGNYVGPHDGVFHGARVDDTYDYTASDYGLDHGTVLWSLAKHYSYTGDKAWLEQTLPHMLKAIEWIERQRALTHKEDVHGGKALEYGLLPAGHLEDNSDWGYWFAVNSYCVAGMIETAAAMKDIGHPDADKVAAQANDFREALRTSVQRCTELAPVVRLRDGTYAPCVPTRAYQRFRRFGPLSVQYYSRYNKPDVPCYRLAATREVLYGPMILLNLQIFDPQEPIADWILNDWEDNLTLSSSGGFNVHGFTDDNLWFSQGGMVFQANLQNPIWVYLYRHETPAAIRSIYNAFVSCLYPDVNAFTEEFREWRHASGPFYKSPDEARFVSRLRDMLVMESGDELWLAAGVPRLWLASREGIQVDGINTIFGSVAYSLRAGQESGTLEARVSPPSRRKPRQTWLYLRMPDKKQVHSIQAKGQELPFDSAGERVLVPSSDEPIELMIRY